MSCSHFGDRQPAQDPIIPSFPIEKNLRLEIDQFQELVEEALVWRSKALEYADLHKEKFNKQNLSHEDMLVLYESAKDYLVLREKILELAHRYERVAEGDTVVEYKPGSGTALTVIDAPVVSAPLTSTKSLMRIDPTDAEGRDLLIRIKISLSAALVLYDNYMIGVYPYLQNKKTRKMLNEDIPGFHSTLDKITDSFFDLKNRNKMIRAIALFKGDLSFKDKKQMETDRYEQYLEMLSLQSPFYAFISEKQRGVRVQVHFALILIEFSTA